MSLASRLICLVVLLSSFLLIFATGRSNISNFERVQHSIEEIYKDRLVVKGLIYDLSSLVHQKELAIVSNSVSFYEQENDLINSKIESNLLAFRKTILTEKEESTLNYFAKNIEQLKVLEKEIKDSQESAQTFVDYTKMKEKIEVLKEGLMVLSSIQLEEGEQKLKAGTYAVKQMNELAAVEHIGLIFVGLMMIGLIFIPGPNKKFIWNNKK